MKQRFESMRTSRRRFLKSMTLTLAAGQALLRGSSARAELEIASSSNDPASAWPTMEKRPLGKTGFSASPLVFGCGAALALRKRDALLDAALEAGINVFDVGHRAYYRNAEEHLAPFLAQHRDEIFLISKGLVGLDLSPDSTLTPAMAQKAAATWTTRLEESLSELGVDQVDAYYVMAANNAELIASDEISAAAQEAKRAGKIRFLGLSTHQNQQRVLEAAMKTGSYSLAMVAVTPAGWYDWQEKSVAKGTPPMTQLEPFLARVRDSGIALVGMKAGRVLAGRWFSPWSPTETFDTYYDKDFANSSLSPFQKSYAYVLSHGVDVVNADMQSMAHLRENVIAAATASKGVA